MLNSARAGAGKFFGLTYDRPHSAACSHDKGYLMRILPIALALAVFSTVASAADTWFPFKDTDSAFSVDVPGTPTVSTDSTKLDDGTVIPIISYEVDLEGSQLAIVVGDCRKVQLDTGKAIDGSIAELKQQATTIEFDRLSVLDGQVGHEVGYVDKDGNHVDDRIYFFQGREYQAIAMTMKGATSEQAARAQQFLVSFHFTPSKT
jgi:hypothetical protein